MGRCHAARKVRTAAESEFAPVFPDCDPGAMPVFGSLYGVPVIVSHELLDGEEFSFTAGTHRDVVRIRTKDYLEAERPQICGREEILA